MIVETERLVLRRFTLADADFMLALMNDPAWLRFIGDRGIRTNDDARDYIQSSLLAGYERFGFGMYVTELKESGLAIGICGLLKKPALKDVDLGFAFLPKFWGKGYAFESASAVLALGKNSFGLTRIVAVTSPDNYNSIKVLEKLGFKFEQMLRLTEAAPEIKLFACEQERVPSE